MPRVYKRKTHKIDPAVLRAAVWTYRNNDTTQETVAAEYNIPRSTLSYYAKEGRVVPDKIGQGRGTIFTKEEELEIEKFVIDLCMRCYPLSRSAFAKFVFHMAKQTGREARFSKHEDRQFAGRQFIHDFLLRHPRLSFRTGTCISLYRVQGFNEMAVNFFFENLEAVVREYGFRPHQIYNVDESGFTIVPETRVKYLGEKGSQRVPVIRRCERGQLVTMVGCFSAAGIFVPPYFVFNKNLKLVEKKIGEGPPGSSFAKSKSGWISSDVFVLWLQFFAAHLPAGEKTLLILDNHSAHLSWEGLDLCKQKGIVVLTLPPHCSHEMQPCDVGFFSPLKYRYATSVDEWQRNNPFKFPLPEDIPGLLKQAWEKTAREEVGINAFKHTGIWDPILDRPKREVYDQVFQDGTRNRRAPIRFRVELEGGAIVDAEQAYLGQVGELLGQAPTSDSNPPNETDVPVLLSHVSDIDVEMVAEMDEDEFIHRDDLLTVDENELGEIMEEQDSGTVTIDTSAFKEMMQVYNGVPAIPEPSKSTRKKKSEIATSEENMAILEEKKNKKDQKSNRKQSKTPLTTEPPPKKRRGRPPKSTTADAAIAPTQKCAVTEGPSLRARYKRKAKKQTETPLSAEGCLLEAIELPEIVPNPDMDGSCNSRTMEQYVDAAEMRSPQVVLESVNPAIPLVQSLAVSQSISNRDQSEKDREGERRETIAATVPVPGPSWRSENSNILNPSVSSFKSRPVAKSTSNRDQSEKDRERERRETIAATLSVPGPSWRSENSNMIYPSVPIFQSRPVAKSTSNRDQSEKDREGERRETIAATVPVPGPSWRSENSNILNPSVSSFKSRPVAKSTSNRDQSEKDRERERRETIAATLSVPGPSWRSENSNMIYPSVPIFQSRPVAKSTSNRDQSEKDREGERRETIAATLPVAGPSWKSGNSNSSNPSLYTCQSRSLCSPASKTDQSEKDGEGAKTVLPTLRMQWPVLSCLKRQNQTLVSYEASSEEDSDND